MHARLQASWPYVLGPRCCKHSKCARSTLSAENRSLILRFHSTNYCWSANRKSIVITNQSVSIETYLREGRLNRRDCDCREGREQAQWLGRCFTSSTVRSVLRLRFRYGRRTWPMWRINFIVQPVRLSKFRRRKKAGAWKRYLNHRNSRKRKQ